MAARIGREVTVEWGPVTLTGVREVGLELNGEPIDITCAADNGVRKLATNLVVEDQISVSLSGVVKTTLLRDDWIANTRTRGTTLTYPDGYTISGSFIIVSYSEGEPYKDASTFEATLESRGAVANTAP